MNPAETVLKTCLGLNSSESCLVMTDGTPGRAEVAELIFREAQKITAKARLVRIAEPRQNGEEPEAGAVRAMASASVVLIVTAKSLSHTKARMAATDAGARIASMPGITMDIMSRAINVDYPSMQLRTAAIADALDRAGTVHITTKLGTELTFSVEGRTARGRMAGIFREPGQWGNLPDGEAYIAPAEGTANGVYVVDASHAGLGRLDEPIRIIVKDGGAVKAEGAPAGELMAILEKAGKYAFNLAEFGIGTNERAQISGVVLEDEKVLGTCHLALGSNSGFGGSISVALHLDGVIKEPTILLDNKLFMENGKLK